MKVGVREGRCLTQSSHCGLEGGSYHKSVWSHSEVASWPPLSSSSLITRPTPPRGRLARNGSRCFSSWGFWGPGPDKQALCSFLPAQSTSLFPTPTAQSSRPEDGPRPLSVLGGFRGHMRPLPGPASRMSRPPAEDQEAQSLEEGQLQQHCGQGSAAPGCSVYPHFSTCLGSPCPGATSGSLT